MNFIPTLDEVSYPVEGNRGTAIGHEKQSHGGIMPHSPGGCVVAGYVEP